jgi:hypothetical protein
MKYLTFTREMARAYAEGRKRMTRLVIKPPFEILPNGYITRRRGNERFCPYPCPYGKPGDQIILGTTWAVPKDFDHIKPTELPLSVNGIWRRRNVNGHIHGSMPMPIWSCFFLDDKPKWFGKLRPGRFLPGFLRCRMPCVTIKNIRAERVQDITNEEAILEGIFETPREPGFDCWSTHGMLDLYPTPREAFKALWESINAGRGYSWDSNPWVWVLGW